MASVPSLEIDLLRSFALIAETGSFTRAAERVGRSQSAVSLQVQRLELLVGHRLFARGKGAIVQLTPKGRDLLGPAWDLLLLNDETVRALRGRPQKADRDSDDARSVVLEGPWVVGRPYSNPSIAVLPFQNISGDPDQDYFAAGVVEDIVAALSRITWLSVTTGTSGSIFRDAADTRHGDRRALPASGRRAQGRGACAHHRQIARS